MKKIEIWIAMLLLSFAGQAQYAIKESGKAITENFDKLPAKNGIYSPAHFKAGLSSDWVFKGYWQDPDVDKEYLANDGSKGSSGIISYGLDGDKNRSLGSISGGHLGEIYMAYRMINKTKKSITSFKISFDFEQWRIGSALSPQGYKLAYFKGKKLEGLNPKERKKWTYLPSQFTPRTPINTGIIRAINGKEPEKRIKVQGEFEVDLKVGEEIYLVWMDDNSDGYDHGIAIDNLELIPQSDASKKILADASAFDFGISALGSPVWEDLHVQRLSGEGEVKLTASKGFKLRKKIGDNWSQELSLAANESAAYVAFVPQILGPQEGQLSISSPDYSRSIPLKGEGQKSLKPGDLAILTWNCEDPKNLQFLTLTDVPVGTHLYITDKSWIGEDRGFSEEENMVLYVFEKPAPAGTIISFKGPEGIFADKADLHYSPYYETLLFFQGNPRCPQFILGAGMGEQVNYLFQNRYVEGYVTTVTPPNLSKANKGIMLFGKEDNWQYDLEKFPLAGDKKSILNQLYNLKNWKKSNVKQNMYFEPLKGKIQITQ